MKTKQAQKPEIKKVKIHEHIAATKKSNNSEAVQRKRGRPRKDNVVTSGAGNISTKTSGDSQSSVSNIPKSTENPQSNSVAPVHVVPVHDTTAESRAFLQAPFSVIAGLSGIPKLDLYPTQLDALAPTFKPIYDKYIVPKLGENAEFIAFGVVLSGVVFEKVSIYQQERAKQAPPKQEEKKSDPIIENVVVT